MKRFFLILTVLVGLSVIFIILLNKPTDQGNIPKNLDVRHVKIKDQTLVTYLPQTSLASQTGLAAFDNFSDDRAMLFRMPTKTRPSLWMKNMKFDIDMVWLGPDDQVVHITQNVSHKDQTTVYRAPRESNAKCVVELNAGASQRLKLKLGDKLEFTDSDEPLCLEQPRN